MAGLYTVTTGNIIQAADIDQLVNAMPFFNVKVYGADPTGVTDSTTAISNARSDAHTAGGGVVYYPPGTYLSGNQTLYSNIIDMGAGSGASIIKLKNGANTDLFSAQTGNINLSAAFGAGAVGTLSNFGLIGLTLDGNKANQSSGPSYPLRFYGYRYLLRDVIIRNGYSGGMLGDWNGGAEISPFTSEQMEATLDNLYIHSNNGIGLQMGGPNDSRLSKITSYDNSSHGFHFGPNIVGVLSSEIHPYQLHTGNGAVGVLCEAGTAHFINCMFEGSDTAQLVILGKDCSVVGGEIFGNVGFAGTGLQLGQQAGQTPIPGQIFQSGGVTTAANVSGSHIVTSFRNCTGGAINEANVGTINTYYSDVYQTSGTAISSNSGFLNVSSTGLVSVAGLTADGSTGKGGTFQIGSGSFNGFQIINTSGTPIFNVNTFNSILAVLNGKHFDGYSDGGSTNTYSIHADTGNISTAGFIQPGNASSLYSGSGVPSAGFGNNGDFYFRVDTPGTANQRLYVKSAGAWVGVV